MTKFRRILASVLVVCMLITMLPTIALASDADFELGEVYQVGKTVTLTQEASSGTISAMSIVTAGSMEIYHHVNEGATEQINVTLEKFGDESYYANGTLQIYAEGDKDTVLAYVDGVYVYPDGDKLETSSSSNVNVSSLAVGTYDIYYVYSGVSYKCDQTLIVTDGLVLYEAYAYNMATGVENFEVRLSFYGFDNESFIEGLTVKVLDSDSTVVATSTGEYRGFDVDSYDASFYMLLSTVDGQAIDSSKSYTMQITHDGEEDILCTITYFGLSTLEYPSPSIDDFVVIDGSTSTVSIDFSDVILNDTYTYVWSVWDDDYGDYGDYVDTYIETPVLYQLSVRGSGDNTYYYNENVDVSSGSIEISLTSNGNECSMADLEDSFYIELNAVYYHSGWGWYNVLAYSNNNANSLYSVDNPFYGITSGTQKFTFNYGYQYFTQVDGEFSFVAEWEIGTSDIASEPLIELRDYAGTTLYGTAEITSMTYLGENTYYIEGVMVIEDDYVDQSISNPRIYVNGELEATIYTNTSPKVAGFDWAISTGSSTQYASYINDMSSVYVLATGMTGAAGLVIRYSYSATASVLLTLDEVSPEDYTYAGYNVYKFDLTAEQLEDLYKSGYSSFYLGLTQDGTTYILYNTFGVVSDEGYTSGSTGGVRSWFSFEYYPEDCIQFSINAINSSAADIAEIVYGATIKNADGDVVGTVTGIEALPYSIGDDYQYYTFTYEEDVVFSSGKYTICQVNYNSYTTTITLANTSEESTSTPYAYNFDPEDGGRIQGYNLSASSVYTGIVYQGYDKVDFDEISLTYIDGDLYMERASYASLDAGVYQLRIYMDGTTVIGEIEFVVADLNVPVFSLMYKNSYNQFYAIDGLTETGSLAIVVEDNAGYSYIRVAETEQALATAEFVMTSQYEFEVTDDGEKTVYIEFSTDAEGTVSKVYTRTFYLDTDSDYGLEIPDTNGGFYDYYECFTLTVTADHQYANAYAVLVDAESTIYERFTLDYVGIVDGKHTYENSNAYVSGDYNVEMLELDIVFYLTNSYGNEDIYPSTNTNYTQYLRSEYVVGGQIIIGDSDKVLLTGYNGSNTISSNSSTINFTGYASKDSTVTFYSYADGEVGEKLGETTATSGGAFSIELTFADGTHSLMAVDSDGKESVVATIYVDTIAPVLTDMYFTFSDSTNSATLFWVFDDTSEELTVSFELYTVDIETGERTYVARYGNTDRNATITATYDDGQTFELVVTDSVGNSSSMSQNTSDNEAPVVTSFTPEASDTVVSGQAVTLAVTATDNIGVSSVTFEYSKTVDGTYVAIASTPASSNADGSYSASYVWDASALDSNTTYYVRATVYDAKLNSVTDTTYMIFDNIAPNAVKNFSVTGTSQYVHINWTYEYVDADFGSFMVYWSDSIDGEYTAVNNSNYIGMFQDGTTLTAETEYFYYVTTVDTVGNESAATEILSASMTGDTTSPEIGTLIPEADSENIFSITVGVTATDNYRLSYAVFYYQYFIENDNKWSEMTEIATVDAENIVNNESFVYDWDISGLPSGSYKITAEVYDTTADEELLGDYTANAPATATTKFTIIEYVSPTAVTELDYTAKFKYVVLTWEYSSDTGIEYFEIVVDGEVVDTVAENQRYYILDTDASVEVSIRSVDMYGGYAETTITAIPDTVDTENPLAIITGHTLATTGETVTFSAVNSTDNDAVASYTWTIGDDTLTGSVVEYTFNTASTNNAVTLTVADAAGNSSTATIYVEVITVSAESEQVLATFYVVDSALESTPAVADALIVITPSNVLDTDDDYWEIILTADENGEARAVLDCEQVNVAVTATGYSSRNYTVAVENDGTGNFTKTLGVPSVEVVVGTLTSTDMTIEEIEAAGIDVDDPDNQQVVYQSYTFEFTVGTSTYILPVATYINSAGDFALEPELVWSDGGEVGVMAISEHFYLVIYGEAHWLKEMYNVELMVINNDQVDSLTDISATLTLPEGLSLATMLDGVQSSTIELDDVAPNGTTVATWYVRGDSVGEYHMTAEVSGKLGDTAFYQSYTTQDPVIVYAGEAFELMIEADAIAFKGEDYTIDFTLKNVTEKSIYNLSFYLTGSETYRVTEFSNGLIVMDNYESSDFVNGMFVEELKAGESITITFVANDLFTNEELGVMYSEYVLNDIFTTTLDGSTTSIPCEFVIRPVDLSTFVDNSSTVAVDPDQTSTSITLMDKATIENSEMALYSSKTYTYTPTSSDTATVEFYGIEVLADGVAIESGAILDKTTVLTVIAPTSGVGLLEVTYNTDMTYTANYTIAETAVTVAGMELSASKTTAEAPYATAEDVEITISAALVDIVGNPISDNYDEIVWSVDGTGVSVVDGVLTITSLASGVYTVTAKADEVEETVTITVTKEESVATTIEILRNTLVITEDTLVIPVDDSTAVYTYTAKVYDQYGVEMEANVTWENEEISLTSATALVPIIVKATAGEASASIEVEITNIAVTWTDVDTIMGAVSYTYGDKNGVANIPSDGTATVDEEELDGTFAIVDSDTIQSAGAKTITVSFTVTSAGDYENVVITKVYDVNIAQATISEDVLTVTGEYTYTGEEITPDYTVTGLEASDYEVSIADNVNAGTATVTVTGIGNYTGTVSKTFTIAQQELTSDMLEITGNYVYSGEAITPTYTVTGLETSDYEVEITDNVNAGTATVTVTGVGNYTGEISATFTISQQSLTSDMLVITGDYTYTGDAITPTYEVTGLVLATDYTVAITDNVNAGIATVTVTGTGNYTGEISDTFTISVAGSTSLTNTTSETANVVLGIGTIPSIVVTGFNGETVEGSVAYAVDGVNISIENLVTDLAALEVDDTATITYVFTATDTNYAGAMVYGTIDVTIVDILFTAESGYVVENTATYGDDWSEIIEINTIVATVDGISDDGTGVYTLSETGVPNAGTYSYEITYTGEINEKLYENIVVTTGRIEVAQKALTIKPVDISMYNTADLPSEFTISYVGLVDGDEIEMSGEAVFTLMTQGDEPVEVTTVANGTYDIIMTGATFADDNYIITMENGTLTITTKPSSVIVGGIVEEETVAEPEVTTNDDGDTVATLEASSTVTAGTATTEITADSLNSAISAAVEASEDGTAKVEIVIDTDDATALEVTLNSEALANLAESEVSSLVITSDIAVVTISSEAAESIASQAAADIQVIVSEVDTESELTESQKAAVGDSAVYDLAIMSDGEHITYFDGGIITVELPYELKEGENPNCIIVWYVDDEGKLETLISSYNSETGKITFKTTHFSYYAVGYVEYADYEMTFIDVSENDWFYTAVQYNAYFGLMSGTSATTFEPNTALTRNMFFTILHRMSGDTEFTGGENWYDDGVNWAVATGVSDGTNGDGNISREELVTMLWRYSGSPKVMADISMYTDVGEVSSWAIDAMAWAITEGIITGRTEDSLAPSEEASRAEVATIMMRYLEMAK